MIFSIYSRYFCGEIAQCQTRNLHISKLDFAEYRKRKELGKPSNVQQARIYGNQKSVSGSNSPYTIMSCTLSSKMIISTYT